VTLYPDETNGTREVYYAPTLSGGSELLTETLTYQWLATAGGFSDATTGGGHDILGNQSLLGTVWQHARRHRGDARELLGHPARRAPRLRDVPVLPAGRAAATLAERAAALTKRARRLALALAEQRAGDAVSDAQPTSSAMFVIGASVSTSSRFAARTRAADCSSWNVVPSSPELALQRPRGQAQLPRRVGHREPDEPRLQERPQRREQRRGRRTPRRAARRAARAPSAGQSAGAPASASHANGRARREHARRVRPRAAPRTRPRRPRRSCVGADQREAREASSPSSAANRVT